MREHRVAGRRADRLADPLAVVEQGRAGQAARDADQRHADGRHQVAQDGLRPGPAGAVGDPAGAEAQHQGGGLAEPGDQADRGRGGAQRRQERADDRARALVDDVGEPRHDAEPTTKRIGLIRLTLQLAQPDPGHRVVRALGQDQRGPAAGRQDVLRPGSAPLISSQIVSAVRDGLVVAQRGVPVEVRLGSANAVSRSRRNRSTYQLPDVLVLGVDVDREVEEVADRQAAAGPRRRAGRLQHVEALDDEHVGPVHHDLLAGHDVVGQVE